MGKYTDYLDEMTYDIFDEDDYIDKLKNISKIFRTFDVALDTFLVEHDFKGDLSDIDCKVSFIVNKFKEKEIPQPRNIKKWYTEHRKIERQTAFLFCIAFSLNIDEVNEFLRRVCLTRGFDCHNYEELIYYFGIKNKLSYNEIINIFNQVQHIKQSKLTKENIIYTDLILEEVENISSSEDLVKYLNSNIELFAYNNATAYEEICNVWEQISRENGIAHKEKKNLYVPFDLDEYAFGDIEHKTNERKRSDDSMWEIYLQILGLSGSYMKEIYNKRSLKAILENNELLHPIAEYCFPDRDGLNKIINGAHVSHERVRKILILLVYYKFWAGKAVIKKSYEADYMDADRCTSTINDYLIEANYPTLYLGNPYDFIIILSMNSDSPLVTFRDYMHELLFNKIDCEGNLFEYQE